MSESCLGDVTAPVGEENISMHMNETIKRGAEKKYGRLRINPPGNH